jgi:hypothetical protein
MLLTTRCGYSKKSLVDEKSVGTIALAINETNELRVFLWFRGHVPGIPKEAVDGL